MRKWRGFTLIEVLVVFTIMSLLIVVGFSFFSDSRERGEIADATRQIKTLETALQLYANDKGVMPPGNDLCSACGYRNGASPSVRARWEQVADDLYPDYIDVEMYYDPWGNYYAYDNNYKEGAYASSYTSIYAGNSLIDQSDGIPTMLCSVGPNGMLETGLHPGNGVPDGPSNANNASNDPYLLTGSYGAEGDDICLFIYDSD